jgi:hypothetical protein
MLVGGKALQSVLHRARALEHRDLNAAESVDISAGPTALDDVELRDEL